MNQIFYFPLNLIPVQKCQTQNFRALLFKPYFRWQKSRKHTRKKYTWKNFCILDDNWRFFSLLRSFKLTRASSHVLTKQDYSKRILASSRQGMTQRPYSFDTWESPISPKVFCQNFLTIFGTFGNIATFDIMETECSVPFRNKKPVGFWNDVIIWQFFPIF